MWINTKINSHNNTEKKMMREPLEVDSKLQIGFKSKAQTDEKARHTRRYVSVLKRPATSSAVSFATKLLGLLSTLNNKDRCKVPLIRAGRWGFESMSSMYVRKYCVGAVIFIFLFKASGYCFKEDTLILTLRQKMTEISELHEKVSRKISVITKMRQELSDTKQTFIAEIIRETKGGQISTYKQAVHIPRIHYNLKLIQQLEGYTTALRHKIAYLKDANEQLVFYYQQIEDDLKIIATLKDMDVEGLLRDIDQALETYTPETKKHIIFADQIEFYPPQEVWRKIMAGAL